MIIPLMPKLFSGFWAKGNRSDQQTNRWRPVTSPDSFRWKSARFVGESFQLDEISRVVELKMLQNCCHKFQNGYPIARVFLALVLRSNRSTCSQPPVDDGKWHTQLTTPISQTHSDMFLTCVYVRWFEKGKKAYPSDLTFPWQIPQ